MASALLMIVVSVGVEGSEPSSGNARRPTSEADLRFWLENMIWYHRFSLAEVKRATGLEEAEIRAAIARFRITPDRRPRRQPKDVLRVLPYPGGRHPRLGFLEGAVRPQRETKFSVFTPWDESSYVVADIPEAIWCQHGLLYLAHTHVPTMWTRREVSLKPLEWRRHKGGRLEIERRLPNGVLFGVRIQPRRDGVAMDMWLTNGSKERLTDLRVQNCILLKGARGFSAQTNANKVFTPPYAACRSDDGRHWVITAWEPIHRCWGNARCPCLHADPKFPDCEPGETQRLRGWLSFYEGSDIRSEVKRLETIGWRKTRH